ncbi:MAG TPA: TetR family transcriptional regulator [Baekduia sp.]
MAIDEAAPKRKRDAAATREAILASAIEAFGRHGYDGAGVREIAQGAGVTAKLVNRYFGTKEKLFAEAVDASFMPPTIVREALEREGPGTLSERMADVLVRRTGPEAGAHGPFLITLRSAANPVAAEVVRDGIERHVEARVAALLDGDDARLRSDLTLSLMAGVWLLRHVIGVNALAEADHDRLRELITKAFDALVEE